MTILSIVLVVCLFPTTALALASFNGDDRSWDVHHYNIYDAPPPLIEPSKRMPIPWEGIVVRNEDGEVIEFIRPKAYYWYRPTMFAAH